MKCRRQQFYYLSRYDAKPNLSSLAFDTVSTGICANVGNSPGRQSSNHARFCLCGASLHWKRQLRDGHLPTFSCFACEWGSVSESNFPPFRRLPSVRLSFVSSVWHQQSEEVQTTISRVGFCVRACRRRVDIKAYFVIRKRKRVCTFTRVL